MSLFQRAEEIADRFGLADDRARESHAKRPFDSQDEFRPPQAVDAEIPLQAARWGDVDELRPLRMQLAHEFAYHGNEFVLARRAIAQRDRRAELFRACLHRSTMTHARDTTLMCINACRPPCKSTLALEEFLQLGQRSGC